MKRDGHWGGLFCGGAAVLGLRYFSGCGMKRVDEVRRWYGVI